MFQLRWSPSEKKIAHKAYDGALNAALAKTFAEFKRRANAVAAESDMWAMEEWLREQRQEIDQMFDYRYSQLPLVFAWAIRVGNLREDQLAGLSEDKLALIRSLVRPLE